MKLVGKKKFSLLAVFLLALVVACGPSFRTFYNYYPPKSPEGQYCANQCLNGKSQCEANCQLAKDNCELRADADAERDFRDYERNRIRDNKPVERTKDSFRRTCFEETSCQNTCGQNYNLCFTNCGGQITTYSKCTSFCEKVPLGQPLVTQETPYHFSN